MFCNHYIAGTVDVVSHPAGNSSQSRQTAVKSKEITSE
jgi:hypothetical protein